MRWVEAYGCVLFDLDGTLYAGDVPFPGAVATVTAVRDLGIRPVFMTNNSSRTPDGVVEHMRAMGFRAEPSEVVTSATVTADLLARRGTRSAYVVGRDGIRQALARAGVEVVDGTIGTVDAVVVGWDPEVTYEILRAACVFVQRGASLVGTNPDGAFPAPDGTRWPGAGALLAAVVTTTGVEPEVIGKPFPALYQAAREAGGGGRPLVVGDRLDTDIAGAAQLGWDSFLVLWGITEADDLEDSELRPTRIGDTLGALLDPA